MLGPGEDGASVSLKRNPGTFGDGALVNADGRPDGSPSPARYMRTWRWVAPVSADASSQLTSTSSSTARAGRYDEAPDAGFALSASPRGSHCVPFQRMTRTSVSVSVDNPSQAMTCLLDESNVIVKRTYLACVS
ncbi:hypothetical protein MFU01_68460 [Myxococcus fulvus]|uniref:Uncharacterized protein n=1 Tax=Myxococcus fulvus TaxID=33 RepID=A0A511TCA3_MYXFU|nr:hypothetical protein MFU01_68460 [Myxococcus fulvus]